MAAPWGSEWTGRVYIVASWADFPIFPGNFLYDRPSQIARANGQRLASTLLTSCIEAHHCDSAKLVKNNRDCAQLTALALTNVAHEHSPGPGFCSPMRSARLSFR
eukprot:3139347-Prymnesium_polylepis.1